MVRSGLTGKATVRWGLIVVVVVLGLVATGGTSSARPLPEAFQAATPEQASVTVLDLGAPFTVDADEFVTHRAFTAPSPDLPGYTEVRASISIHNTSEVAQPYSDVGFISSPDYPRLQVRDAAGVVHPVDSMHPARASAPGSAIVVIEPGLAGRWTVGFTVPTVSASSLVLEMTVAGRVVAAWDLLTPSVDQTWSFDPTATSRGIGESIPWADGVTLTATTMGSLVCGDPTIEPVAHIVALNVKVENLTTDSIEWPGKTGPVAPAVAQWADGSAADFSLDTYVGDTEPLTKMSAGSAVIPPGSTYERAMVFAAPRDGRMVDIADLPVGVLLAPAEGDATWLDLAGVPASVGVSPLFCDLGFTVGPIPYSFAPGPRFQVRGEQLGTTDAERDAAARDLLTTAIAGAALYYDANGQTFDLLTATRFLAYAPTLRLVSHTPTSAIASGVGSVYFSTDAAAEDFLYLITQSSSDRWFCAGVTAYQEIVYGEGADQFEAGSTCYPDVVAASSS